jgi:hypothetical protein
MQIDHDREEPPRDTGGNGVLYAWLVILPALWAVFYFTGMLEWRSAVLGALTGGIFVIIMTEITGNRVPSWMRR